MLAKAAVFPPLRVTLRTTQQVINKEIAHILSTHIHYIFQAQRRTLMSTHLAPCIKHKRRALRIQQIVSMPPRTTPSLSLH
jgi:hypothetical protein